MKNQTLAGHESDQSLQNGIEIRRRNLITSNEFIDQLHHASPRQRLEIDSPIIYHHGDTVEVVGTPFDTHNSVGLVTFDNFRHN